VVLDEEEEMLCDIERYRDLDNERDEQEIKDDIHGVSKEEGE